MKYFIIYCVLIISSSIIFSGCGAVDAEGSRNSNTSGTAGQSKQAAEKIEVVHFHATQQCWSCITVGELALKTIKERFPEEYKNGTIIFKDVNGQLPVNKDLVIKFQAGGSSLFTNAIVGGKDNIQEDVAVWRYVANERQFMNYFEAKLKRMLGKQ